jgi:tRNA pseudouridine38-40 synthase
MERYQVILAYDGTRFEGFQRQGEKRTVQVEVEAALRKIGWQVEKLLAAGRTDSGVHASGQVIAFDLEWSHGCEALLRAMNANLPPDIAVRSAVEAAADFHPRYHARQRSYQYSIYCQAERDPLMERYSWRVWPAIELERMAAAANLLPGKHDFAAFGAPMHPGGNTVRTVLRAGWQVQDRSLRFEVAANAFLYHMVRRMVFLQVLVGQDRLSLESFKLAVEEAQAQTPGLAPAHGLVLTEVCYEKTGP